jgi:pimeloyl-ACP methyl ester carboxylesterase
MRTEVIQTDGLSLGLLSAGNPAKPALVLLHGWPQSKEVYDRVVDGLADDHFVLAFDLPEIGDSRGAPRSAEKRDHAHRVSGAIIMNTVIPGIDPWSKVLADPRIWHFAFHATPDLPELLVAGHQRSYFDFFIDFLAGRKDTITLRHRASFAKAYERPAALRAGFDWYRTMQADAERNVQPKEIQTPMLYLRGDADGGSPEQYVQGLQQKGAKNLSGAVLHDSGEFAPLEVPEAFMRAVLSFAQACPFGS